MKALIVNGYDIRTVVSDILVKYPDIRETPEYESLQDLYIEYTMSCDPSEQQAWMKHYISKGLSMLEHSSNMIIQKQYNSAKGLEFEAYLNIIVAYDLLGD